MPHGLHHDTLKPLLTSTPAVKDNCVMQANTMLSQAHAEAGKPQNLAYISYCGI